MNIHTCKVEIVPFPISVSFDLPASILIPGTLMPHLISFRFMIIDYQAHRDVKHIIHKQS